MAIKKKKLSKGHHVHQLTLSRNGGLAAGHTSPSYESNVISVVEMATGAERLITFESPSTRIASVDFVGADVIVAALHKDPAGEHHRDHAWTVLVIDPTGKITSSGPLTSDSISGALAVGPDGQVALVVSTTLFFWKAGELHAGKAPQKVKLEVDEHSSQHLAWTEEGSLLVLASDKLVEVSPKLKVKEISFEGVEAFRHLSCSGSAVSFVGSLTDEEGFADAVTFVVDRKTGAVTAKLDSMFHGAHLRDGLLLGASGGKAWLKKKGWKHVKRTPELEQGYVMRVGLNGRPKEVVPMKLGRVDAFVSAGDVVVIGSDKGMTWYSGVFSKR